MPTNFKENTNTPNTEQTIDANNYKNPAADEPGTGAVSSADSAMVIPVIQEEVTIDKQVVESGKVHVSKKISRHEELIDVPIFREEVTVERVPINHLINPGADGQPPQKPPIRYEGDLMIIPVVEEQVFIEKRLVLVEELHIRKQIVEQHKPQQISLHKEEVEVRRTVPEANSAADQQK